VKIILAYTLRHRRKKRKGKEKGATCISNGREIKGRVHHVECGLLIIAIGRRKKKGMSKSTLMIYAKGGGGGKEKKNSLPEGRLRSNDFKRRKKGGKEVILNFRIRG